MIFNMKLVHVIYCVKRSCLVSTFFMLLTIPILKIITQYDTGTTLTYIKITYDCLQMLSNYNSKFFSLEFSETRLHLSQRNFISKYCLVSTYHARDYDLLTYSCHVIKHVVNLNCNNFHFFLQLTFPPLAAITNGSRQTSVRQDFTV